jgi:hypothetical protein
MRRLERLLWAAVVVGAVVSIALAHWPEKRTYGPYTPVQDCPDLIEWI